MWPPAVLRWLESWPSPARRLPNLRPAHSWVGDKVTIPRAKSVLEISHVHHGGDEVNRHLPGTNLEWFRVRTDSLTFVERKPPTRTSNLFTSPEPVFDGGELLERIETVQRDSLKRY